jgi:hypothetical protein
VIAALMLVHVQHGEAAPPSATFASGVCGKAGISNDDRRRIAGHVTGPRRRRFRRTMKTSQLSSQERAVHGSQDHASKFLEEQQVVKIFNDPLMLTSC